MEGVLSLTNSEVVSLMGGVTITGIGNDILPNIEKYKNIPLMITAKRFIAAIILIQWRQKQILLQHNF